MITHTQGLSPNNYQILGLTLSQNSYPHHLFTLDHSYVSSINKTNSNSVEKNYYIRGKPSYAQVLKSNLSQTESEPDNLVTARQSEGPLVRRFINPKVRLSEGSLVRRSVSPNFLRFVSLVFRSKDRYRTVLNLFNIQSFIKLSKRSKILIFTS